MAVSFAAAGASADRTAGERGHQIQFALHLHTYDNHLC